MRRVLLPALSLCVLALLFACAAPRPVAPQQQVPDSGAPPDRKPVRSAFDFTRTGLPSLRECETKAHASGWGTQLRPIPSTVIDKGVLRHVPYASFRAGDYELNVYGDPETPCGIELGLRGQRVGDAEAQRFCLVYIQTVLPDTADGAVVAALNRREDKRRRGDLTFEITPPTAEDSEGGWWISVYNEKGLEASRATPEELAAITEPPSGAAPKPGQPPTWTPDEIKQARPPAPGNNNGGPVYVRGYYRKDGTYVSPHTRRR
jgi:hypothetical protein